MATTKFTYTIPSYTRLYDTTKGVVTCPVTIASGVPVPADAIVTSASISVSKVYQYSDWREFRIWRDGRSGTVMSDELNTTGKGYDDNGNNYESSNTWPLYADTELFVGLETVVFASMGNRSGDPVIMGFVAGCVVTVTVNYNVVPRLDDTQPADAKVIPSRPYTLAVAIKTEGSPTPYAYQWYKDGVAIEGATAATLDVFPELRPTTYYCTVTNAAGTVQTRTATIEISSGANLIVAGQVVSALPYLFINGKWIAVVPYVHTGGSFKISSMGGTGTVADVAICGEALCGTVLCG